MVAGVVQPLLAADRNPLQSQARDAMTDQVASTRPDSDLSEALKLMEEKQVRRIPVVNEQGILCGIVAQADVALEAPAEETAEVVKDVSKPSDQPARVN